MPLLKKVHMRVFFQEPTQSTEKSLWGHIPEYAQYKLSITKQVLSQLRVQKKRKILDSFPGQGIAPAGEVKAVNEVLHSI